MTPESVATGPDAAGGVPAGVRHPPFLLFSAGALALAGLILGLPGALIDRGHRFAFDSAILLATRGGTMHGAPVGQPWLKPAMLDVTAIGGVTVLVLIVALTAGFLVVRGLWLTLALVLGGTIGGSLVVEAVKALVDRPRPMLTDHLVQVSSASFPSGHAANGAIVYLTIATLMLQIVEGRGARRYILACAVLLVVAIGCSRVYLGVHWPSDVIAGWSFGALWAVAWWALGAAIRRRRAGRPVLPG